MNMTTAAQARTAIALAKTFSPEQRAEFDRAMSEALVDFTQQAVAMFELGKVEVKTSAEMAEMTDSVLAFKELGALVEMPFAIDVSHGGVSGWGEFDPTMTSGNYAPFDMRVTMGEVAMTATIAPSTCGQHTVTSTAMVTKGR
jgi:hypothetical protein